MPTEVKVKINEIINQRGMSLRELSRLTDIRHAALSELANQKRQSISFNHIIKIADSLKIYDIREIIEIIVDENEW